MTDRRVARLGDRAISVELPGDFTLQRGREARAVAAEVRRSALPGIRDVVVTGAAVTVHVDPLRAPVDDLEALLRETSGGTLLEEDEAPPIVIPVRYGGEDGPDLDEVAARCGCTASDVVGWHSEPVYHVIMMGFVAGFAYLWPLNPRLHLPRRSTPRTRVPAGSVAIAGPQTAIYPADTPGGWHLIGRTGVRPYDATRDLPFLFETGRRVRFEPQ
jgi:KipI family sensor histidine kinase inhibitor